MESRDCFRACGNQQLGSRGGNPGPLFKTAVRLAYCFGLTQSPFLTHHCRNKSAKNSFYLSKRQ